MAKLSDRSLTGMFMAAIAVTLASSWPGRIAWKNPSSVQEEENYAWLGSVPAFRKMVGSIQAKKPSITKYLIANDTFEASMNFPMTWFKYDQTGQVQMAINRLAARNTTHRAKLISDLIIANGLCCDGQNFFDTDHSEGKSGTQINAVTASQVTDLNIGTATAPTVAEAIAAIIGMIGYMQGYKDDEGEPMNEDANSFIVMSGTAALHTAITQACSSALVSSSTNPLANNQDFKVSARYNPRLSSLTTAFFIFRDDVPGAFIEQELEPLNVQTTAMDGDYAIQNDAVLVSAKARRGMGYGLWQYAAKATLS